MIGPSLPKDDDKKSRKSTEDDYVLGWLLVQRYSIIINYEIVTHPSHDDVVYCQILLEFNKLESPNYSIWIAQWFLFLIVMIVFIHKVY